MSMSMSTTLCPGKLYKTTCEVIRVYYSVERTPRSVRLQKGTNIIFLELKDNSYYSESLTKKITYLRYFFLYNTDIVTFSLYPDADFTIFEYLELSY